MQLQLTLDQSTFAYWAKKVLRVLGGTLKFTWHIGRQVALGVGFFIMAMGGITYITERKALVCPTPEHYAHHQKVPWETFNSELEENWFSHPRREPDGWWLLAVPARGTGVLHQRANVLVSPVRQPMEGRSLHRVPLVAPVTETALSLH